MAFSQSFRFFFLEHKTEKEFQCLTRSLAKMWIEKFGNRLNAVTNSGYEFRGITGNGNDVNMMKVH